MAMRKKKKVGHGGKEMMKWEEEERVRKKEMKEGRKRTEKNHRKQAAGSGALKADENEKEKYSK